MTSAELLQLLQTRFGFAGFRKHQEAVCSALVGGRDVLLVMPTGAGKSLCYQVPGIARKGTTLVISPLLALIEDQVAKLSKLGLRAERIHSGRSREDSRAVCGRYLSGELDYLFIAPERLSVPGFLQLLKRRTPSLVAVDEAHCISQWGHDFRPDYRLLGERLTELRPAPIAALTATATPVVQKDIAVQLRLKDELRSIQGFRRENISIQVVELNPGQRPEALKKILSDVERRPAIVYAPTRKVAEQLTEDLRAKFKIEAYHAGMPSQARDRVQDAFLGGRLEVIVATVAFGMGVDKADIRTVIHAGLPGSVEGYYQEIGRAGRDGKPSQAILMHSFADQRTHEFFFERDYPEVALLRKVHAALGDEAIETDELRHRLKLESSELETALSKLWIHGGALVELESVKRGPQKHWEKPYLAQAEHRRSQLKQMTGFTSGVKCRMLSLVEHFGDRKDDGSRCGICDFCAPDAERAIGARRGLSELERSLASLILAGLAGQGSIAAGRLFTDVSEMLRGQRLDRSEFERLISAMARQQWLAVEQDSFEKDGQTIAYRRLLLTRQGAAVKADELSSLQLDEAPITQKKRGKTEAFKKSLAGRRELELPGSEDADSGDPRIFEALRAWRRDEARKQGTPAFRILSDRVLKALCQSRPESEESLLRVPGIGPKLASKYGPELLKIVAN